MEFTLKFKRPLKKKEIMRATTNLREWKGMGEWSSTEKFFILDAESAKGKAHLFMHRNDNAAYICITTYKHNAPPEEVKIIEFFIETLFNLTPRRAEQVAAVCLAKATKALYNTIGNATRKGG